MSSVSDERGSAALLGPHGFLGVVGAATRLYRRNIGRLLWPYVVFTLSLAAVAAVAQAFLDRPGRPGLLAGMVLFLYLLLLVLGASALASVTAVVMTDDLVGKSTKGWDAGGRLKRVGMPLAIAAIYSAMIIAVAIAVPMLGQWLFFPLFLGPPILAQVIAIEGRPTPQALSRSRFLLAGNGGRLLGYLVSICFGWSLARYLVYGLLVIPLAFLERTMERVAGNVVNGVVLGLLLPWLAAATLVCYLDLRVRKDDLDLAALGRERPAQP